METTELETPEELKKRFLDAILPSEKNNFKAYFHRNHWTPEEFAALMAGLDPKCYQTGHSSELTAEEFAKRKKYATKILGRFPGG